MPHKSGKSPLTGHTRQMPVSGKFTYDAGRLGIMHGNTRLEQTGNPLRPEQHFKNLFDASAVVTQFPHHK